MSSDRQHVAAGWSLGLALVAIAAFFLVFSRDIDDAGAGYNRDPGPRLLPIALAIVLLVGGLYQLAMTAFSRIRLRRFAPEDAPRPRVSLSQLAGDWGFQNVVLLVAGLCGLVMMIPWLGFSLSASLLATAMMTRLGYGRMHELLNARAPQSRLVTLLATLLLAGWLSIVMVAIIYLLFDRVFKSPLPTGELGLPF